MSSTFSVLASALRKRIERLEELLELVRVMATGAALASVSFAGPAVATQADATALPASVYTTSRQVYTLDQEAIWQYIPGTPGTVGVPALSPNEVIAASGGVLARTNYSSPKWRVDVNDIYIDPANVAASDANDGFTALTPLKTGYELFRRWGWGGAKPIVGPNLTTSPDGFLTIHVVTDLTTPDSLPIKVTLATNASLRVKGETITMIHSGTLTNAVTAMNPTGNVRLTLRDNALASWAAFAVLNRRVRMIDGPAIGGTFQPQTNSLATPGQVQCSACQTTDEAGFSTLPTTVTPAVGNTYHVEQLTVVNLGEIDIDQELNPAFGGFSSFINLVDFNLPTTGGEVWSPVVGSGTWLGPFMNFYQCTVDRIVDLTSAGAAQLIACYYSNIVTNFGGNEASVQGGGANGAITGVSTGFQIGSAGALNAVIDSNFVASQMAVWLAGNTAVRNFAVWNVLAGGFANASGNGVLIGFNGTFGGNRSSVIFTGLCWGNNNAGVGMLVGAQCGGAGVPQVITGTGGDLRLGSTTTQGVYWDATTSTYLPAGGQATTWALITAAKGAPGYGGSAHWPDQNAHWNALETT